MSRPDGAPAQDLAPLLLAWGAILIPLFALVAPKVSYWPLVIAGIVGLARLAHLRCAPPRLLRPLLVWSAALLLWIAVSTTYALDSRAGLILLLKLSGFAACGLLLIWTTLDRAARMRPTVSAVHLAGSCAVSAALAADFFTGGAISTMLFGDALPAGPINRNTTAIVYLALFVWPLCIVLRDRCGAWIAAIPPIVVIAFAWIFGQFAIVLGLLAGAAVFGSAMAWPRLTGMVLAAICAGIVVLAPLAGKLLEPGPWLRSAPISIQFSSYHRAKIWSFTADRIFQRPVFGWGIDASRRIPGGGAIVDINRDLEFPDRRYDTQATAMPLHPHNAALQVWLELGGVGALLLALLCGAIPVAVGRTGRPRASVAAGLAMYSTAYVLAMLSFSLWQSRWHALLWLAGASAIVMLHDGRKPEPTPTPAIPQR